jgi:IclR family pca regulon transcriptional regulator
VSSKMESRDFVSSLARGLAVIRSFGEDAQALTLSEVAQRTAMSRAAARRFLLTLDELGYVTTVDRRFCLTPRVLDLGYAYLSSRDLPRAAHPFIEKVTVATQEACSVCVLDGTEVVYVAKVPGTRVMTSTHSVGNRVPAYPTSMGRVLLAALAPAALDRYFAEAEIEKLTRYTVTDEQALRGVLKQVAADGYSVVDQELEEGLRSIAVPILDKTGGVAAALTVCASSSRIEVDAMIHDFLPTMREAAAGLSAFLSR